MNDNSNEAGVTKGKPELIRIDEGEIRSHLDQIVRGTVEETLNALLEAEADAICRVAGMNGPRKGQTPGPAITTGSSTPRRGKCP